MRIDASVPAKAGAARPPPPADLLSAESRGHHWQAGRPMRAGPAPAGRTRALAAAGTSGQAQGGADPPPTGGQQLASRCDTPPHHTPPKRFPLVRRIRQRPSPRPVRSSGVGQNIAIRLLPWPGMGSAFGAGRAPRSERLGGTLKKFSGPEAGELVREAYRFDQRADHLPGVTKMIPAIPDRVLGRNGS
jgi:hypothetical protein